MMNYKQLLVVKNAKLVKTTVNRQNESDVKNKET